MTPWLAQLIGIQADETVSAVEFHWGAWWAQGHTFLVLMLCLSTAALVSVYYLYFQSASRTLWRVIGIVARAAGLAALIVVLAQPALQVTLVERLRPLLLLMVDGSDSMNLPATVEATDERDDDGNPRSRIEQVQAALANNEATFADLSKRYRLRAYLTGDDGALTDLSLADGDGTGGGPMVDTKHLADQLRADAEVTALGTSLEEVRRRHRGRLLDRVVMIGDFDVNSGTPVLTEATKVHARIDTVGVGPRQVADARVSLQCDLVIKKDEQRNVYVEVKQTGLDGSTGELQLFARSLGGIVGESSDDAAAAVPVGEARTIEFDGPETSLDIPYRPTEVGRVRLEARLEAFDDEVLRKNNVAARDVIVRDEAIRLLFVEHEPTWEWRFVKEVFHRDRLVGRGGFRTYLHSADFAVRRSDRMFLTTLDQTRAALFANDVIFLSDVPEDLLSSQFQDLLVEYVRDFGGGLVVITGPRFGGSALARTRVADMLPVVLSPSHGVRGGWFRPQLTPSAAAEDFMNLSDNAVENEEAWDNLGELPWYQPVARLHPQGVALASHPLDNCVDGATPQPIIATRRFGKGEVVYLGFNEMWRLRRIHDEKYYRRFWGQLMYRLGLSHALGSQKRFKVTADRDTYQVGSRMTVRVEAYDDDFQPLGVEQLTGRLHSAGDGDEEQTTEIPLPVTSHPAEFEATVPLFVEGVHRLLVDDPVKKETVEVVFNVEPVSIERRSAIRNAELQQELASQTGGQSYELEDLARLADDVDLTAIEETSYRYIPLWNTWLIVVLVIGMFLTEWTGAQVRGSDMNDLTLLKAKLRGLRRRRAAAAWLSAAATVVAIALTGLIAAFCLDVVLHLGAVERLVVLLAWAALAAGASYYCIWPVLRHGESLTKLALLVEQRQGVSSELVAALQFSDAARRQYGLPALRGAVISDTAELSGELDYRHPDSGRRLGRNLLAAATVVAMVAAICLLAGDHARVFANRFLLGDATFPTKTQIRVLSPGDRVAYGQPVSFRIAVEGERPDRGKVRLEGSTSGDVAIVDLVPDQHDTSTYTGHMRRALEDCTYMVEVGDARLGPRPLTVIPLPKVNVDLDIEAPTYAAGRFAEAAAGQQQSVALAGSRVTPIVTADKELRSATIRVNGKSFALERDGDRFTLDTEDPLLTRVATTLRYEVEVEDVDGLRPQRPVSGVLRVREDRPPRITSRTATRQVLPGASPAIEFSAADDFGLKQVSMQRTVLRRDTSTEQTEPSPEPVFESSHDHPPEIERRLNVSFSDLALGVGDRVICTLQAVDYRGSDEGRVAQSEPLVFEVTDRDTLLKGLSEADAKIDRDLDSIIRAESGLGETQ